MKLYHLLAYVFVLSVGRYDCNYETGFPTLCHVCKHTVDEFLNELSSLNTKDVLKLGPALQSDERQKTIVYQKSELRLIEALENMCGNLRNYKVHKDKQANERYSRDESTTFRTLNKLRERGVKVDLGFPDEMWDTPDAEVVRLKTQCENMVEQYEEVINEWYYYHQDSNPYDWLCRDHILAEKRESIDCLQDLSVARKGNSKKTKQKAYSGKQAKTRNKNRKKDKKGNKIKNTKKDFGLKTSVDESSKRDEL